MAGSPIVTLLSQRPTPELETMRGKMQADIARLEGDIARLRVEVAQVEDALARQGRQAARTGDTGAAHQHGSTAKRILDMLSEHDEPVSPAAIITHLEDTGGSPTRGAVHTMISRLVARKELARVGQGLYKLASQNGSSGEPHAGPTENETTEPLLPATGSQEAS